MGCYQSKKVAPIPYYTDQDESDFLQLGLTHKELEKFSHLFAKFDITNKRELDLVEFLIDVHLELNIMTLKIFNLIDGHHDNSISFREFVLHSWYFLTMTTREMEEFSFRIYNQSGSGVLSREEMRNVLIKIHGKKHVDSKMSVVMELMDRDQSKGIDLGEFMDHIKKFPVLVFPVFAIQDTMRQHIMGESFWKKREKEAIVRKKEPWVQQMLAQSKSDRHLHNVTLKDKYSKQDDNQPSRSPRGSEAVYRGRPNLVVDLGTPRKTSVSSEVGRATPRKKSLTSDSTPGIYAVGPTNSPRRKSVDNNSSASSTPRRKSVDNPPSVSGTPRRKSVDNSPSVSGTPRRRSVDRPPSAHSKATPRKNSMSSEANVGAHNAGTPRRHSTTGSGDNKHHHHPHHHDVIPGGGHGHKSHAPDAATSSHHPVIFKYT